MSGPGSGLGSSVGTGIEAAGSYGTQATIDNWYAMDSHEIKRNPVWYKGAGLRGGTLVRDDSEVVLTNQDAGGNLKLPVYYNSNGRLLGSLMGSLAGTPTKNGETSSYTMAHEFQNSWQQSISIEEGIARVDQTIDYYISLGAKITEADFEGGAGSALLATYTVDAQDRYLESAGTSPTEPTGNPFFAWHQMTVALGAYGSEAQVGGVSKWAGSIKRAQAAKRFNAGNVTTNPSLVYAIKDEPVDNNFADITGTLSTEFIDDTIQTYFTTNTEFSLIVAFTSAALAATGYPYSITFAFPRCRILTGEDPTVPGPDIVRPEMAYEVMLDGTHPACTITTVNTDSALK